MKEQCIHHSYAERLTISLWLLEFHTETHKFKVLELSLLPQQIIIITTLNNTLITRFIVETIETKLFSFGNLTHPDEAQRTITFVVWMNVEVCVDLNLTFLIQLKYIIKVISILLFWTFWVFIFHIILSHN